MDSFEAKRFRSYADHFAQAIMFIPAALAGLSKSDTSQSVGAFSNMFGFWYNFVF
jgi:preprotein translocase subunit SecY